MSFEGSEDKNMRRSILISSVCGRIETFLVLKRRNYAVKFAALFIFTLFQKIIQLKLGFDPELIELTLFCKRIAGSHPRLLFVMDGLQD